jgi:hypothetical protein
MRLILGIVIGGALTVGGLRRRCAVERRNQADGELGRGRQEPRRRDRARARGLEEDCRMNVFENAC